MVRFTFSAFILAASTALAAAAAAAADASCPANYPGLVNTTTSANGLTFTIASSNPATNGRAVQLRPNPFLPGAFYAGVDANSSVLLGNLVDGGIYSQGRNEFNQLYNLGPTGYLNVMDQEGNATRYIVGFADATQWPGTVDTNWTLSSFGDDGTYALYHDEPLGLTNGFLLCEADFDLTPGAWYDLLYVTYAPGPLSYPGCQNVAVRTTVAPVILNGACEIGGYTA